MSEIKNDSAEYPTKENCRLHISYPPTSISKCPFTSEATALMDFPSQTSWTVTPGRIEFEAFSTTLPEIDKGVWAERVKQKRDRDVKRSV